MIRKYCDYCGSEIKGSNAFDEEVEAVRKKTGVTLRAQLRRLPTPTQRDGDDGIHYCLYCVLDTINTLDDRLKGDRVAEFQPIPKLQYSDGEDHF